MTAAEGVPLVLFVLHPASPCLLLPFHSIMQCSCHLSERSLQQWWPVLFHEQYHHYRHFSTGIRETSTSTFPLNKDGFSCRSGWKNEIACSQAKVNAIAIIIPRCEPHWKKMTDTYSYVGAGRLASRAFPANLVITISWLINTVSEFICLNHLGLPLQSSSRPKQCYCITFQTHPDVRTTATKGTGLRTQHY